MPITPFHLAAGAGLWRWRRAFWAFIATNAVIDLEVALRWLAGDWELHGIAHTLPFIAIACVVAAIWSRGQVLAGVAIGGVSHVLLDAMIHWDVLPLLFTRWNPLLGVLTWHQVEALCLGLGAVGWVIARRSSPAAGRARPGPEY